MAIFYFTSSVWYVILSLTQHSHEWMTGNEEIYTVNSPLTQMFQSPGHGLRYNAASPLWHAIANGLIYTFNSIQICKRLISPSLVFVCVLCIWLFCAQSFSWKGITWKLSSAVKLKRAHIFSFFSNHTSFACFVSSGTFAHVCCTRCACSVFGSATVK